jgi:hypothetical protein
MKRITVVFMTLLLFPLITSERAYSQEASDDVVITGGDSNKDSTKENQPLDAANNAAKIAESRTTDTMKNALSVVQEVEGVVYLAAPSNNSYTDGTKILFIRRRGPRLEPISQGQVIGEERNPKTKILMIKVQIDRDATVKYPQTGDRAVLLANEMVPPAADPKENHDIPEAADSKKEENNLPGYLEYGMGLNLSGSIEATPSSTIANVAKKSSGYRFKNSHFAYYSDFFPVGIEMDSHSGDFPTSDYQAKILTSSESVSMTTFNYRFWPLWGHLAFRLRYAMLKDDFKTSAVDGALLTTKTSASGFGVRMDYEFVSPTWKPAKNDFFVQLQNIQAEYTMFPSITAKDEGISRGTDSGGSKGSYMGAEVTALVWLDFVPIFKRWVVQAGYHTRSYDLKFSGATVSEPACAQCVIAENGTSKEKETDMRFFIGIRIDDPIRMMFPPKDKKKP